MGLIKILSGLFGLGGGANRVAETVEIFRENAEKAGGRDHDAYLAALHQLAAETAAPGAFGRIVDGLNRLPRPALAFCTIGLFAFAMIDPEGFAPRITGLALIPEPMWYLMGGIVGFYFGARELHKQRQTSVAASVASLGEWRRGSKAISAGSKDPETPEDPGGLDANPALALARSRLEG